MGQQIEGKDINAGKRERETVFIEGVFSFQMTGVVVTKESTVAKQRATLSRGGLKSKLDGGRGFLGDLTQEEFSIEKWSHLASLKSGTILSLRGPHFCHAKQTDLLLFLRKFKL